MFVNQGAPATAHVNEQTVTAGFTLRLRETKTLYVLEAPGSGSLGRFIASCSQRGAPSTRYVLAPDAPSATVAMSGRGVSRGAELASERPALAGGYGSGLERWIIRTGNESEEAALDADLYAVSLGARAARQAKRAFCEFGLSGVLEVHQH